MGWHKGLSAWLPLAEVFEPATQGRAQQPPPLNGSNSGIRPRVATARQKAFLEYLGQPAGEKVTREEAAVAISDALENPKLTNRIAKWGDEKLRLHPDLFQEEIDYRRANRISRYLELCQTEGAEVVKDVTKAHVQVLIESLDKRQVGWDHEPRSALWDYLLPSVSEHFPQLVQDEWKGKLRYGGTSKVAAAYAGVPATGMLVPGPSSPGAIQAALRGIVFGLIALGAVISGIYLFRDNGKADVARNEGKAAKAPAVAETKPAEGDAAKTPEPAAGEPAGEAANPTKAPLIGANPENAVASTPAAQPAQEVPAKPAENAVASTPPTPTPAPAETPVPVAAPASAPAMAGSPFTPAPPPPGMQPALAAPAVEAPAPTGPAVRNSATLTQAVTVQLQFGKVTLPPGTRLRLLALEGTNVRVNFNNNIVVVPVASTDVDPANTVVAAAPLAPAGLPISPLPAVAPTATATPPPTVPKSSPLSDL
jgi:hypothetical protein